MNTRNAFHGLDENLRALAPKYDPPSLSFSNKPKNLLEQDSYFKANLPPTYGSEPSGLIPINKDETVLGKKRKKKRTKSLFLFSEKAAAASFF